MSVVGSLSFALPRDLQPTEERYLTSPITVAAMLLALQRSGYTPPPGPIVDPCACGYGGFSIGAMAAEFWGREVDLSDLVPQDPSVRAEDATRRSYHGAGLVITNPAFTIADDIRRRALADGAHVCLLRPMMAFMDAGRDTHLLREIGHDWRQGFGLTTEDARRLMDIHDAWDGSGKEPLRVRRRPDSISGYGLAADGRHHAWGLDTAEQNNDVWTKAKATRSAEARALAAPWFDLAREWTAEHVPSAVAPPQLTLF